MCLQSLIPSLTPTNLHFVRKAVCTSVVISASRWHFLFNILPWWLPNPKLLTDRNWRTMEAHKPSWAALLQQTSDPVRWTFFLPTFAPFKYLLVLLPVSAVLCASVCTEKLSFWVASPSAVEESTFRNAKKGLVTTARHIAWASHFFAMRSCEMCWCNALRM